MYKIWFFPDNGHFPVHVVSSANFDTCMDEVVDKWEDHVQHYSPAAEQLMAGHSVRVPNGSYGQTPGTLVCVRLTGL
jgi:hypothetical protein